MKYKGTNLGVNQGRSLKQKIKDSFADNIAWATKDSGSNFIRAIKNGIVAVAFGYLAIEGIDAAANKYLDKKTENSYLASHSKTIEHKLSINSSKLAQTEKDKSKLAETNSSLESNISAYQSKEKDNNYTRNFYDPGKFYWLSVDFSAGKFKPNVYGEATAQDSSDNEYNFLMCGALLNFEKNVLRKFPEWTDELSKAYRKDLGKIETNPDENYMDITVSKLGGLAKDIIRIPLDDRKNYMIYKWYMTPAEGSNKSKAKNNK
jgi:hypothetical protein